MIHDNRLYYPTLLEVLQDDDEYNNGILINWIEYPFVWNGASRISEKGIEKHRELLETECSHCPPGR